MFSPLNIEWVALQHFRVKLQHVGITISSTRTPACPVPTALFMINRSLPTCRVTLVKWITQRGQIAAWRRPNIGAVGLQKWYMFMATLLDLTVSACHHPL